MTTFATHRFSHHDHHISIRVETDGVVQVLETALYGEIVSNVQTRVDRTRARDIVADMQMLAAGLSGSDPRGDLVVGFGVGEQQSHIWTLQSDFASADLHAFADKMRGLALETLALHAPDDELDATMERRVRDNGPGAQAFALWSLAFFAAHIVAGMLGLAALLFCIKALGIPGMFVGIGVLFLLVAAAYYMVGQSLGRKHGDALNAWKPAAAAIIVPALLVLLLGGSPAVGGLSVLLPLIASIGGDSGAARQSASDRGNEFACA